MHLSTILRRKPQAIARISGSTLYPDIRGSVYFYQTNAGVLVIADMQGLPKGILPCEKPVLGMHIHEGSTCTGDASDPFADVRTHYNPNQCPHPYHTGDLPPLFSCSGHAFSAVLTDRFTVFSVIGKTVVIHAQPDDFTTQPAGNSGTKIACGSIEVL